jgi:hypothetical protein
MAKNGRLYSYLTVVIRVNDEFYIFVHLMI